MTEFDPKYASGEEWFLPPDGILDGSDFEIAQRYIDGARADARYFAEDQTMSPELRAQHAAANSEMEAFWASQEDRLKSGDGELAGRLAHRMQREVDELNRGERSTVTGQAHLLGERLRRIGHVYYVSRPTTPGSIES